MYIHEMSDAECRQALKEASHGRLGCTRDNEPYVVPIYFSFEGEHLYGFTTLGQKIEWMRANPFVCLEIDTRNSHDDWMSVIVFGRYRIRIDRLTGHRATPDQVGPRASTTEARAQKSGWWTSVLQHLRAPG